VTCLDAVMRHGSIVDKMIYKAALAAHTMLCGDKRIGMSVSVVT